MIAFIDDHREAHGVEPICKVLQIAPSTYYDHVASVRCRIHFVRNALVHVPKGQRDIVAAVRCLVGTILDEQSDEWVVCEDT